MHLNRLLSNLRRLSKKQSLIVLDKQLQPYIQRGTTTNNEIETLQVVLTVLNDIICLGKLSKCSFIDEHIGDQNIIALSNASQRKVHLLRLLFQLVSWISVCQNPNRRVFLHRCMKCLEMVRDIV